MQFIRAKNICAFLSYHFDCLGVILFYCSQAPSCGGGQTPICDMRKVYKDLAQDVSVLEPLMDSGVRSVRYSRFLPSSRSQSQPLYNWEKTFYTEDKMEVERTLEGLGYNVEWRRGDTLHYWYVMTSVRKHPVSGEMVWCNQVNFSSLISF